MKRTEIENRLSVAATATGDVSLLDFVCNRLEIKTIAGREAVIAALCNCKLLDNKQQDYGPKNISRFGAFGCVVRMSDKIERAKTICGLTPEVKAIFKRFQEAALRVERNEHHLSLMMQLTEIDNELQELVTLHNNRRANKVNETILDTFDDLSNYGVIARLIETKRWPDSEPEVKGKQ